MIFRRTEAVGEASLAMALSARRCVDIARDQKLMRMERSGVVSAEEIAIECWENEGGRNGLSLPRKNPPQDRSLHALSLQPEFYT